MLIALLMMAASPGAEALRLGRQIAETGTLAIILPLMKQQQLSEMIAAAPALTPAEQATLRTVADRQFASGRDRLLSAEGRKYAELLTLADLRAVAAFQRSPAAARMRQAMPAMIAGTMQAMAGLDFKGDVATAMCAETGKLCPEPARAQ